MYLSDYETRLTFTKQRSPSNCGTCNVTDSINLNLESKLLTSDSGYCPLSAQKCPPVLGKW